MFKGRLNGIFLLAAAVLVITGAPQAWGQSTQTKTFVRMETVLGDIDIELYNDITPLTVANFVDNYVNRHNYDNSFIHRSEPNFVIQGGGFKVVDSNAVIEVPQWPSVVNEYNLPNMRGTIAMARTNHPDSATSQWFFNLDDENTQILGPLNNGGYAVFGRVIGNGMDVVDAIAAIDPNDLSDIHGAWKRIPLIDYEPPLALEHLILLTKVSVIADANIYTPGPYEGNYDLDDDVDLADFAAFADAFSTVQPDPLYNPTYDHHFDGIIDERDFIVFASYWLD